MGILKQKNKTVEIILMLTSMLKMDLVKKKLWRKFRKKTENEKLNNTSKHQRHHSYIHLIFIAVLLCSNRLKMNQQYIEHNVVWLKFKYVEFCSKNCDFFNTQMKNKF